jgi:hypothetical protein
MPCKEVVSWVCNDLRNEPRRAFQVKRNDTENISRRQEKLDERLDPNRQPETAVPVLGGTPIRYEMAKRVTGIVQGGIGLITQLVKHIGLGRAIDERVHLLKKHQPYHESDHVLSLAYNIVAGGLSIEDVDRRRKDAGYLDALGAERIPASTTAGDFLRRFTKSTVIDLMNAMNEVRADIWRQQPKRDRRLALIDVDGTIVPTLGEKKEGADFSYKGTWGYAPLLVSLANTQEVLYVVNRSGNRPSHDGCVEWLDKAVDLVRDSGFKKARLRGDTDFSLTANFDRWSESRVEFVFGIDAHKSFVNKAKALEPGAWRRLERPKPKRETASPRIVGRNFKDEKVEERCFTTYRLSEEHYAEMPYTPRQAKGTYRMVVLRKRINVLKGQQMLEDEIRYHFYVTNVQSRKLKAHQVIFESNARCHQENLIEQLKNGVRATQMPCGDFTANWAYMVIGSLAWNLKVWLGLVLPSSARTLELLRMEYRRFAAELVTFSAQIVKTGRTLVFRVQQLTVWTEVILEASDWFRRHQRA